MHTENWTDVVNAVRQKRLELDLTYVDLALQVGVTFTTVFRALCKGSTPHARTQYKFRKWLTAQK